MRNSGLALIMKAVSLTVLVVLAAGFTACKRETDNYGEVMFIAGNPGVQRAGAAQSEPLKVLDRVNAGDIITADTDSQVTVQIGGDVMVQVLPGSSLCFDKVMDSQKTALFLETGAVLNKVKKLQKGVEYEVRTSTALAAVRGTEFMVKTKDERSEVAVYSGTVEVTMVRTKEQKPIKEGVKAIIDREFTVEPLNDLDKLYKEKISMKSLVGPEDIKSADAIEKIQSIFKERETQIDLRIAELGPQPLEEIRKKYKRVDIITLYTGRVIRGAILERGETYSILTPDGLVSLQKKSIKNINVVK